MRNMSSKFLKVDALWLNEIYYSIQGESSFAGLPCVFIRCAGCSLRCSWCDTDYAFYEGEHTSFDQILQTIRSYSCRLVELTGGEPLDQPSSYDFLKKLCDEGLTTLLETGGHRPIESIDERVHRIIDMKCPSSKMTKRNRLENLDYVTMQDEVKFVIGHREDYDFAVNMIRQFSLDKRTKILFSAVHQVLEHSMLAKWILDDHLQVRLQAQLHKIIWGAEAKSV